MASGSDEASFRAAAEGKLKVEGMAVFAQWFTDGVKLILYIFSNASITHRS